MRIFTLRSFSFFSSSAILLGLSHFAVAQEPLIPSNTLNTTTKKITALPAKKAFATRITADNATQLIRKGPDAIGGIGDWFLTNGTLCAIVSDVDHEGDFSSKGGSLVDLGFCGRSDDHFSFTHDLLQGSRKQAIDTYKIALEYDDERATIIVNGQRGGNELETRFTLSQALPSQIHIDKHLSQKKDAQELNFFSPLIFNLHSLEPFVLNSVNPELSNGFQAEEFSTRGVSAMSVAARDADTIITISPNYPDEISAEGIAYGWHLASAERVENEQRTALPRFMLADATSTAMLIISDDFYLGDGRKMGWLQISQTPLLSLNDKSVIESKEIIYVGKRNDVASITDQLWSDGPHLTGTINDSNAGIHIYSLKGKPISFARSDSDGKFAFKLPKDFAKEYKLVARASGRRETQRRIAVNNQDLPLSAITLPPVAKIVLPQGQAMRLLFVGIDGTPQPDFADQLTGSTVTDDNGIHTSNVVSNVFLAGKLGDKTELSIAPGNYLVYATRGPEFSLEKTTLNITKYSQQTLKIGIPQRILTTPNFIASDLHVHSGLSFDNAFSETERVRSFVAEHGEVMVSSEHDLPVDYAPRIKELGLEELIVSIPAAEVTSLLLNEKNPFSNGHANFFPYEPTEHAYRNGMVNHENRRWRDVINTIKQSQPDVIVQLNHPRRNMALSGEQLPKNWKDIVDNGQFLDHMGSAGHPYNPHKPLHTHPNNTLIEAHEHTGVRDIDFDLIEVINPGGIFNTERIQAQRLDWLSFVKQGEKIVGTANSDSHHANEQVALPRTMVAMENNSVVDFQQAEFLKSLKSGNTYGTTGPMLNLNLSGAKMGQTFSGQRGQLAINIKSVEWIPVTSLKVQINGETVDEYVIGAGSNHDFLIPMSFDKDSFVTIEVQGPASEDYKRVYPDLTPYAFSNPIYVDYDSDGAWQAPGL